MSAMRATMTTTVLAAALLTLAGCGQGSDPGGSVTPTPSTTGGSTTGGSATDSSGAAADGPADLTIVIDDGQGATTTWHLTCAPAGGDHPTPTKACAALAEHGSTALAAVPADRMCTQIFGGAQTAHISGTWQGKPVDARLSRTDGCQITRWDALVGLLPSASA
jgi:hypothetical protein